MLRPLPLLMVAFAFLGLPACGGGGSPSQGNAVVELVAAPLVAVGGGVAVATAPAPLFVANTAFAATWFDASGAPRAVGQAVASSSENFGLLVPLLPSGLYRVDIELGATTGRVSIQLADASAIADPSASVGSWHAAAQAQVASWRAAALLVVDPVLRATRLADLDEIDRRLAELIGKVASASPAEQLQAARLLGSEPDLSATLALGGLASVLEDLELARVHQVLDALRTGTGRMVRGATTVVAAAHGLFGDVDFVGPGSSLPAAAAVAAALFAHYAGGLGFAEALERGVTPQSDLRLDGGGLLAGAPSLFLVPGVPLRLQPTALCASLTTNDRLSPSAEVRALFLPIDAAYRAFAERPAVLSALVQTPPAAVPELPRSERLPVDRSRLSIADQGNPQVQLTVVAGDLTAALQGVTAPVTTTVTFLFDAAPFAGLSQTLVVAGIALRPNMVPIAAGTFTMGSAIGSAQGASSAGPPHTVTHTLPFWMGKYEVTQAEYETLIGSNPSFFLGANRPVDRVSWDRAVAFCEALTVQEAAAGRLPSGHSYRLPTEAEWEYCCRAGTTTEWNVGSSLGCGQANYSGDAFVFCVQETSVVGSYAANAWGLHDMHGNVQELCGDGWDGTSGYAADAVVDPFVPSGLFRVLRGGGWSLGSDFCRSAHRGAILPPFWVNNTGFRVVCAPVRSN